jgi:hypothetical protein
LRRRFISLLKEKNVKETYFIFKTLAYKLSIFEFCEYYKESLTLSFLLILSFFVILICLVTALTSEFFKNARRLDTYRSVCLIFSVTFKYRHIRPIFIITLILDLTSFCSASSSALILILSFFCSALSSALILILSFLCLALSFLIISLI